MCGGKSAETQRVVQLRGRSGTVTCILRAYCRAALTYGDNPIEHCAWSHRVSRRRVIRRNERTDSPPFAEHIRARETSVGEEIRCKIGEPIEKENGRSTLRILCRHTHTQRLGRARETEMRFRRRSGAERRTGRRTSKGKMAAATATAAATRSSPPRGKASDLRASSVSPFNSHRCPSSALGASFVLLYPPTPLALSCFSPPPSSFPLSQPAVSFSLSLLLPTNSASRALFALLSTTIPLSFPLLTSDALSPMFVLSPSPSRQQRDIPLVHSPISSPSSRRSP